VEYTFFTEGEILMSNPVILDGAKLAKEIEAELSARVAKIKEKTGITPVLATILVGNNPASVTYVRMKGNACKRVGLESLKVEMPESTTTDELVAKIEELNKDERVHGILLQHPVPEQIDEQKCFNTISVKKDVDGVNTDSFGRMTMKLNAYKSATPLSIMTILKCYNIEIAGKEAVVVGRSPILGKPVAMLLLNENATVTVCHSKTENLPEIVRRADIVVGAVGKPRFIKADWIKEGAVLVDAGYSPGNVGDIDLENAAAKSSAYTPVPGGVGPMTITSLMRQTVEAAEKAYGI
jgi:methylenetetrahydrofolate dehydrogenase (NADP+)/methenyltetrahydrofolate cyclohydrolase